MASQDYEEKGIELFDDVVKIYAQAEQEMLAKVAKRVKKGATDTGWNETKLDDVQSMNKQIDAILTSAQTKVMNKVSSHAKAEYMKAADIQFDEGISDYVKDSVRVTSEYMSKNFNTMIKRVTQDENDFKGLNSGAMMYIDPKDTSVLHINPAKFKGKSVAQINEMLKAQEGKYHKNMDMKSLVMHEYGHVIAVNKNLNPTMDKLLSEFVKSDKFNDFVKSLSPDEQMMLPYLDDSQKVAKMVSYYAGTSKDELFAEAFADYYKNGENASEFAKMLGKEVEEISKKDVEEAVKKRQAAQTFKQMMNDAEIPMNLQQLLLATNNLLTNAKFQVLRNADDAYRQIQANASTALLSGVDTRIGVSQRMLNEFAQKGITTFVDKSGRHWDLGSYAEMCARTVSSHAALQGHIQRQEEVGEDLVKVSSIGTTCPICMPWQGVVLSISGKSPKYHSLDEAKSAGLFHPNCKHTLLMYIPELDDGTENEGKVEPSPVDVTSKSFVRNKLIEQQRSNERNIRYWKKRMSMAITPEDKEKARQKVKYWQQTNMLFCEKNGLRRQYARENSLRPNKLGKTGAFIGGSKFEFEELYKDVVGVSSQTVFKAVDLSGKKYDSWLKDEIASLDQLDIDKAQMKDASYKSVTPTSLYKKYIGDNPLADWATVSPYEKGTKEYKSGYAKWLKMQIDEIGVSYKIKPKYTEVHEDIPIEDIKLSATEIYKKYHDGKKPTVAYSEAGGEEGTGMKYGKWVETEKKKLIKEGITKTVPFENSVVEKNTKAINQAKAIINDAKLVAYKEELNKTVTGAYTGSQAVKKAAQEMADAKYNGTPEEYDTAVKKYELAKEKHLEMIKVKAEKLYGSSEFETEKQKLNDLLENTSSPDAKKHIESQYKVYEQVEADKKEEEKKAAILKKIQEAELKKKIAESGYLVPNDKVIEACTAQGSSFGLLSLRNDLEEKMDDALKEMGAKNLKKGRRGTCYFDIHDYFGDDEREKAIKKIKPWQAIGDYTSGSRPHNFAYKENESAKDYFNGARYTREQAQYIDTVLDKAFEVPSATLTESIVVRHGNDENGLIGLLGDDVDYETYTHKKFIDRLKELNKKTESGEMVMLKETGYLSTSPFNNGGFTDKAVELRILCPPGTKGLYVDEYSYYEGEQEVILKRNQKFKFVKAYSKEIDEEEFDNVRGKMKGSGNGYYTSSIIYLQAIPD